MTKSDDTLPDVGDRVRITDTGPGARELVGQSGTVRRFFIGQLFSVGVQIDGEDEITRFMPIELETIA